MAIRNVLLGGTNWSDGETLTSADLNDTINGVISKGNNTNPTKPPIGSIVAWLKTFGQVVSGTNDSVSANKLIDSTAVFQTSGVKQDMIVYNETDGTWSYVVSVDSETQITLNDDIFTATGKTYKIYAVPKLPEGWVECNGQVLNDSESPFNGMTLPNLNSNKYFLRGSSTSGTTGGAETHNHTVTLSGDKNYATGYNADNTPKVNQGTFTTSTSSNLPPFYEVVWIMRVK